MSTAAIVTGILGCLIISSTSLYTAMRLGALPWPLFLAALVSFAVLKRKNQPADFASINVSHTIMTAGSMIAGGLGFTLPAVYLVNPAAQLPLYQIFSVVFAGTILGLMSSWYLRPVFLEKFSLPFPVGTSTAQTLMACVQKGTHVLFLLISGTVATIIAVIRDVFHKIPNLLFGDNFLVSPMAMGLGYLLKVSGIFWAGAGLVMHLGILPLLLKNNLFENQVQLLAWNKSLSMGMMISCGLMHLLISLWQNRHVLCTIFEHGSLKIPQKHLFSLLLPCLLCICLLTFFSPLSLLQAVLIIPVVFFTTFLSCILCGKTGINPLESLGVMGFLLIALVSRFSGMQAILLVLTGAVATGLCGDLMNDFQVGKIMHTSSKSMFIGETIGAFLGMIVAVLLFFVLKTFAGGSFGTEMFPTPQATALTAIVSGNIVQHVFIWGLAIGLLLAFVPHGFVLILGIYMPLAISTPIGLGSLFYCLTPEKYKEKGALVASGCLIGEGLAGSSLALWDIARFKS